MSFFLRILFLTARYAVEGGPTGGTKAVEKAESVQKEKPDGKKTEAPKETGEIFNRLNLKMTAAKKSKVRQIEPAKRPLTAKEVFYHQKYPSHLNFDDMHFNKIKAESHFEFADSLRCTYSKAGERRASSAVYSDVG